jgi:methionyl-tRNA formyltransferase
LRIAFAGTPEFALPALAALRAHHDVVGVLTQPDRPSGRGRRMSAGAVKQAATALHLPLAQPSSLTSEAALVALRAWRPEVLVVVAYGLLLPPAVLLIPPLGCINIHASLLPRWRGAAPIQRALLAGDTETGVTIMQMDTGLDTGPILLQRRLAIGATATGGSLHEELAALGAAALIETLAGIGAGTLAPRPQPVEGASYAPRIAKAEARIDWSADAREIERRVRAFNPRPVADTLLEGEPLKVFSAHAVDFETETATGDKTLLRSPNVLDPGAIVAVRDESIIVRCGVGFVALAMLQRPGRRPVSAGDFARGSHGGSLVGRRLG